MFNRYQEIQDTCNKFPEVELSDVKVFGDKLNIFYSKKSKRFDNEHYFYYSMYDTIKDYDVNLYEI
jgi:hypothetical protein